MQWKDVFRKASWRFATKDFLPAATLVTVGLVLGAVVGPSVQIQGSITTPGSESRAKGILGESALILGLSGGFEGPTSVVEGQQFVISAYVAPDNPAVGAVFRLHTAGPTDDANCRINGFELTGGVAVGNGVYAILPESSKSLDMVPTGEIRFSWRAVGSNIGACDFGAVATPVANPDNAINMLHKVSILPDFSTGVIDLGHLKTVGGMATIDTAKTITPPAASEVTVETPAPRFLAMMGSKISHNDGWSWKDTGRFSMSPTAPSDLLGLVNIGLEIGWDMVLTDDGDAIAPWYGIGLFGASPDGTLNQACLHADYYDNSDKKGGKSHCVDVIGKQTDVQISKLNPGLQAVVEELLARTGHAFVPSGAPNVFYYFEDVDS